MTNYIFATGSSNPMLVTRQDRRYFIIQGDRTMNSEQKNSFYYDGYSDSKSGARYNPPEQPEFATQYRDGYEDYVFETNQFKRMTEYQLQNYITTKQAQQEFNAEYENATRIYNARFKPE